LIVPLAGNKTNHEACQYINNASGTYHRLRQHLFMMIDFPKESEETAQFDLKLVGTFCYIEIKDKN